MSAVSIRAASSDDVPALVEMLRLLFSIEVDFVFDAARQQRGLELLLAVPDRAAVIVAEEDHRVVGMCTGQLVISTAEGAPSVWVEDVVVAEAFRGQGIARALLRQMEAWANERGATRLQLLADTENTPALKFYQRNRWQRTQLLCHRKTI